MAIRFRTATLLLLLACLGVGALIALRSGGLEDDVERPVPLNEGSGAPVVARPRRGSDDVIMDALGNATLRAELGRASWTLLHTMAARFPDEPTSDEQATAYEFLDRLSLLYPCGECARHFRALIHNFPPRLESRKAFMQWLCSAHNIVNKRLGKEHFDCATVEQRWKCGCPDAV